MNENLEVIWLILNPSHLPTGISNIILGIVYHPPKADNSIMSNYLYDCLVNIETQFQSSGTIILGDFNKLKTSRLQNSFKFKQLVKFPTRGQNILDLILTNIGSYYQKPKKLSPFGLSDHATIEIQPLTRSEFPKVSIKTKSRDLRPTSQLALRKYLVEVDVPTLIRAKASCEDKANTLELIITYGLNTILPMRSKLQISNEPPWITQKLKHLIRRRQIL